MIHREPHLLPTDAYPRDEWNITETEIRPQFLGRMETMFATANGYLGMRGTFEEGRPATKSGTYINGFYESWPIVHGEYAHGFATTGQTLVTITDGKLIKLYVDDEPLDLERAALRSYERKLDLRAGVLERDLVWETMSGKHVRITSRRIVSFVERHLCAIHYEVELLNADASVVVASQLAVPPPAEEGAHLKDGKPDPRKAPKLPGKVLIGLDHFAEGQRAGLSHATENSGLRVACAADSSLETACRFTTTSSSTPELAQVAFDVEARAGNPIALSKFVAYHHSDHESADELAARAGWTLDRAGRQGFAVVAAEHEARLAELWRRSDVEIDVVPELDAEIGIGIRQAARFNIFHLMQASARVEGAGIAAKGLTSDGYEGHYFWDTEIYAMPFLTYTAPRAARSLLEFRYRMLDHARARARAVNEPGAKFPWRTINGEEASAYYAAGTAQYHINADIMFALRKYVAATGDTDFLAEQGAEMLVETARLWAAVGFFSEQRNGQFCINGVTGPDEYNTVVDNNTYTNLMARENLRHAAMEVDKLGREDPERYAALATRTDLADDEVATWREAADRMYVPYDAELGIHLQDDSFLNRKPWDFENTPAENYPLLLHYHPLVIYRHQVSKQADLLLAMVLLSDDFDEHEKRRAFDFYDPLTTADSSLSPCIQSILAFQVGELDKARGYGIAGLLMDMGDVGGNVESGCHIAAMGGSWMVIVYGIAGLRDYDGRLRFLPRMPPRLSHIAFSLTVRDNLIGIEINRDRAVYTLREGSGLSVWHEDEELPLSPEKPCQERELVPPTVAV